MGSEMCIRDRCRVRNCPLRPEAVWILLSCRGSPIRRPPWLDVCSLSLPFHLLIAKSARQPCQTFSRRMVNAAHLTPARYGPDIAPSQLTPVARPIAARAGCHAGQSLITVSLSRQFISSSLNRGPLTSPPTRPLIRHQEPQEPAATTRFLGLQKTHHQAYILTSSFDHGAVERFAYRPAGHAATLPAQFSWD